MSNESGIGVYPVGILDSIISNGWRRGIRRSSRYLRDRFRDRNWRAIRNHFNGYLAEWHYPPPHDQVRIYKAGKGWTKRSALRDLGRHIAVSNLEQRDFRP